MARTLTAIIILWREAFNRAFQKKHYGRGYLWRQEDELKEGSKYSTLLMFEALVCGVQSKPTLYWQVCDVIWTKLHIVR